MHIYKTRQKSVKRMRRMRRKTLDLQSFDDSLRLRQRFTKSQLSTVWASLMAPVYNGIYNGGNGFVMRGCRMVSS